jgi:Holliday junction resolvase-like predicted endonuclease
LGKQLPELKKKTLSTKQLQNNNFRVGSLGESLAIKYLKSKNFTILAKNLAFKNLELDILALDHNSNHPTKVLCCVEVKTRTQKSLLDSILFVPSHSAYNYHKHKALSHLASYLLKSLDWSGGFRFDLITVELDFFSLSSHKTKVKRKKIIHYQHVKPY